MIKLFILGSFSSFFSLPNEELMCSNDVSITSQGNYYIHSCFFNSITSNLSGGVIRIDSSNVRFVNEESLYSQCRTTTNYGGAIHITISTGGSAFSKVCSFDCSTSGGGNDASAGLYQFIYSSISNDDLNHISYASMSSTSCQTPSGWVSRKAIFGLFSGKQTIQYTNSSKNYLYYGTGFVSSSSNSLNVSYITVSSNTQYSHECTNIYSVSNIQRSNFISNTRTYLNSPYLFKITSPSTISHTIIFSNTNSKSFLTTSTLTISYCYADNFQSSGSVSFQNTQTSLTNTIQIIHYQTGPCQIPQYSTITHSYFPSNRLPFILLSFLLL